MNDEELREIFRDVATADPLTGGWPDVIAYGKAVAEVADSRAREECAVICDELNAELLVNYEVQSYGAEKCADAIRDTLTEK